MKSLISHRPNFIRRCWLAFVALTSLVACTNADVQAEYASYEPSFSIRGFFEGTLSAHGIVKNRGGEVSRYFNATIDASWNESGVGTLDEYFRFNDGEEVRRVWTLTPQGDGAYSATANDVVGSSAMKVVGNSLFMRYTLELPRNDATIDVNIDDRMYLVNENVIVNESTIRKFGIRFGSITLTIIKTPLKAKNCC